MIRTNVLGFIAVGFICYEYRRCLTCTVQRRKFMLDVMFNPASLLLFLQGSTTLLVGG